MPSLGNLGGGMPGAADGFAGLGQQLADALGGLLNPAEDAFSDPAKIDKPPEIDEPAARDDGTEADVADEPTDVPDDAEPDEDEVTCRSPNEISGAQRPGSCAYCTSESI